MRDGQFSTRYLGGDIRALSREFRRSGRESAARTQNELRAQPQRSQAEAAENSHPVRAMTLSSHSPMGARYRIIQVWHAPIKICQFSEAGNRVGRKLKGSNCLPGAKGVLLLSACAHG